MTLVARLTPGGFPLLVGDILISGPELPDTPLTLPTIVDITDIFPTGSGFVPIRLAQKITVVGDNLVIAWAGQALTASTVIKDLVSKNRVKPFTNDTLMDYFANLDSNIWDTGLAFLGFIQDAKGIAQFGFQYWEVPTQSFGKIGMIGSGMNVFETVIHDLPSSQGSIVNGSPNKLEMALVTGLQLSGTLLTTELFTSDFLLNYFGGGYEVASLVNGKFEKLREGSYLFWYGNLTGTNKGFNLHQVEKYQYSGDTLVIRSVTFSDYARGRPTKVTRDTTFAVPPAYSHAQAAAPTGSRVDMNSKWVCSYFFVPNTGKPGVAVFADVHYTADIAKSPIHFQEMDGQALIVGYERECLDGALKRAIASYKP